MQDLGKPLVAIGLVLVAVGLGLSFGPRLPWLGRLPGDIVIERPGFRLYAPLATCLLLSLLASLVVWLARR